MLSIRQRVEKSGRRMRFAVRGVVVIALAGTSCLSEQRLDETAEGVGTAEVLRQRAERLWWARTTEDWHTVFQFQDPPARDEMVEDEFVAWSREEEPFVIHSYSLGEVRIDGRVGWVEVDYQTSMRKLPDIPARDAHRWEKWRLISGQWHPIPR